MSEEVVKLAFTFQIMSKDQSELSYFVWDSM